MPYIQVKLRITEKQQKQALKGARIRLDASSLGKGEIVLLHPLNARKVANAKNGVNLELSPGEIVSTASFHKIPFERTNAGDMDGSGFFGDVWDGLKKAGKWLKDTGIASTVVDAITPLIAVKSGNPALVASGRQVLKQATGVGLKPKKPTGKGLYVSRGSGLYI